MKSLFAPAALSALATVSFAVGCGSSGDFLLENSEIEVQPRVVLDGLFELGARTQGDVVIEEFVLHAGSVTATDQLGDQLTVDENPLLFRYDLSTGGASANARIWNLPAHLNAVDVNVSPFEDEDSLAALSSINDVDLQGLIGNAGILRGFVLVERGTRELVAASSKESRVRASGDPDGLPARASGDPDGLPAEMSSNKRSSGDPDGLPAKGASKSSGDPDGLPARSSGDPDGLPALTTAKVSGDPDGLPAEASGDPDGLPARSRTTSRTLMNAPEAQLVPFVVVFREPMGLSVSTDSLLAEGASSLDLHFDVSAFLDEDLLASMMESDAEHMVIRGSSSLFTVEQSELTPTLDDDGIDTGDDPPGSLSNLSRRD